MQTSLKTRGCEHPPYFLAVSGQYTVEVGPVRRTVVYDLFNAPGA